MRLSLLWTTLLLFHVATAQNMQAIHGSPYAGSMATDYNPAGLLDAPYKWDLTIAGAQVKALSNAFYLDNYSLLSSADTVVVKQRNGFYRRYAHASTTVNLFHFRYQLKDRSAFSIGANIRTVSNVTSGKLFLPDSTATLPDLAAFNKQSGSLHASAVSTSWAELVMAYAHEIKANTSGRWIGGIQLSVMRGLSGAYGNVHDLSFEPSLQRPNDFVLTNAAAAYGYSANYDRLDSNQSTGANIKAFLRNGAMNMSLGLGVEYVRYWIDARPFIKPDPDDYNWKLAVSILDIGRNAFTYGKASVSLSGVRPEMYASVVQRKTDNVKSASTLTDSLKTIAASALALAGGKFYIRNPTRLLVNFDKYFEKDFYLNAELLWPLLSLKNVNTSNTQEVHTLTVTPRWETKDWGVYLPMQYMPFQGKVWLGLAGKAGPLLVGLHNLGTLIGKRSYPNGGAYVAIHVNPGYKKKKEAHPCPPLR